LFYQKAFSQKVVRGKGFVIKNSLASPRIFEQSPLFLSALMASPMSQFWPATMLTNQKLAFFKRQMRPPPADFAFGMMFYRYATHN